MATHIISFRIESNSTTTARWASLIAKIKAEARGPYTWDETTSFVLIQSDKSAADLALSLYLGSEFSGITDTLLVVDVTRNTYATQGKIDYPAILSSFFPVNALRQVLRA